MAIRGSADVAFFLVGGFDILGYQTQIDDAHEALIEESHTLGDSWREQSYVGVRQADFSQDGFYDDVAAGNHEALSTGPGISRVLCYGQAGTATGAPFTGYAGAMQIRYERIVARGVLHKARATYRGSGVVDVGKILWTHKGTATSSTNAGPIDNTVSTTLGGAGFFQLSAFASAALATAVLARVQHSSDNITYADLVSFAAATAAPTAQRSQLGAAVTVERYVRMAASYQGGAAPTTATMFVGFARY